MFRFLAILESDPVAMLRHQMLDANIYRNDSEWKDLLFIPDFPFGLCVEIEIHKYMAYGKDLTDYLSS